MRSLISTYKNGNYTVSLYDDGTKIKESEDDFFFSEFPDSIDLKITNRCDLGCPMCHENSTPDGHHAVLSAEFLDLLTPGTELAIGGGNPISHPDLVPFLERMRDRGVICNITVNERHLLQEKSRIEWLMENRLVHGVGVSITDAKKETIDFLLRGGAVAHIIAGLVTPPIINRLKDRRVLFLGYKRRGRGGLYYSTDIKRKIEWLRGILPRLLSHFESVSFDNLALSQLDVKTLLSPEEYSLYYMGDDGESSMYVDLVRRVFAVSSTSEVVFPLMSDARDMLKRIKQEKQG